ncbi:MAG: amidohydrolase family protein [Lachnospiraceae bacterium]|nr:amidohydrolase family protein [Lachnospiraceae bacterium]
MRYGSEKQKILINNPELLLCDNGDFKIKSELVEKYEIIDMHCHLFKGLSQLFPAFLQKEKYNDNQSLMDLSCFPFSMELFDLEKIYFTKCPTKLLSVNGIKTRVKLFSGALVLNYATEDRLIKDMDANHIHQSVVQQINPANKSCANDMDNIVKNNNRLYTFASIHPFDDNISAKIDQYIKMDIKGWKLNPHIWGVPIDCDQSITLIKELAKTSLPIMSCSGKGLPMEMLNSAVPPKQSKRETMMQQLSKFEKVLERIPEAKLILAHSGCFDFESITHVMKKYPNTYTDISVQPAGNIAKLIKEIGSEKILFGTDYPFVTQAFSILSVLRATKDEQERINIFSQNAKKLLNI